MELFLKNYDYRRHDRSNIKYNYTYDEQRKAAKTKLCHLSGEFSGGLKKKGVVSNVFFFN